MRPFFSWTAMHLLYADESGSLADPGQRHFVLASVSVFEREPHWIEQELNKIAALRLAWMSEGGNPGEVAAGLIGRPNAGSVEGYAEGLTSYRVSTGYNPATGQQLGDSVAVLVCHPNVGSIEGYGCGIASDRVGADHRPGAGQQLSDAVATVVCHPNVGSIEGYADGTVTYGVGADHRPVLASSSVRLLLPLFATQTLVPSKATPQGFVPTG